MEDLRKDNLEWAVGLPVMVVLFLGSMAAAFAAREPRELTVTEWFHHVAFTGTEKLRQAVNSVEGNWKVMPGS